MLKQGRSVFCFQLPGSYGEEGGKKCGVISASLALPLVSLEEEEKKAQAISVTHPFLQPSSFRIFSSREPFRCPFLPLLLAFASFSMKSGELLGFPAWHGASLENRLRSWLSPWAGAGWQCWGGGATQAPELFLCRFRKLMLHQFALSLSELGKVGFFAAVRLIFFCFLCLNKSIDFVGIRD